jgi:hypothetical protein
MDRPGALVARHNTIVFNWIPPQLSVLLAAPYTESAVLMTPQ